MYTYVLLHGLQMRKQTTDYIDMQGFENKPRSDREWTSMEVEMAYIDMGLELNPR